jgi:16S rRNA (adenine1518-N6/adenine1519-N6)-dimethyltransferase
MCQKIVAAFTHTPGMDMVEIGPGGGALTEYLLQWDDVNYKAIEIDTEKVEYLNKTYPALQGRIINQDILKADVPFEGPFSLIGNFPYNISSPIMFKVLEWEGQITEVMGMFQKEVAQRISSGHNSKQYGILSVLIQSFFQVDYLFDVHENCFTPPPKVKSGVIRCTNLHNPHAITNKRKFINFVKTAFNQRRKTLRNGLKGLLPPEALVDKVFDKRAEQLSVLDFVNLYKQYGQ